MELKIDPEFQNLIPKLSDDEYNLLKESILAEGCRNALIVWNIDKPDSCKNCYEDNFADDSVDGTPCWICKHCGYAYKQTLILIDGHNRYEICIENDVEFDISEIEFDSRDDAKILIINNQLGRRNLPPIDRGILVLEKKNILAMKAKENQLSGLKQFQDNSVQEIFPERTDIQEILPKSIKPIDVGKELAKEAGMSDRTLDKIEKIHKESTPNIIQSIRDGNISINKAYKDVVREEKRQQIQEEIVLNPIPEGLFDVIYSDPPWRYEHSETHNRDIENQYPTMNLEEIKALNIPSANNAVLLMWATAPKITEALEVMQAWGFKYRTCAVWDKEIFGMGYWVRGQHELLLFGVKGDFSPPEPNVRESSVYSEKRTEHSKKPNHYYDMIESYFPNRRYLELFARQKHNNLWTVWGNQYA
jgi:N6-adenosine-specific RNA methylase IME4